MMIHLEGIFKRNKRISNTINKSKIIIKNYNKYIITNQRIKIKMIKISSLNKNNQEAHLKSLY